jgi:hypothetical protein
MAITTLDGVIAGRKPPSYYAKVASPTLVIGRPHTPFYVGGYPGAAAAPAPGIAGAALTSYAGQLPFPAAVGGQSIYLDRFSGLSSGGPGTLLLCDRIWHNSGFVVTTTTAQTINSVAWPARDKNGSTNGDGVYIGLEVVTATGAGTSVLSMSYTNSAGTAGQTSAPIDTYVASSAIGAFYRMGLAAGDNGVRSIQTFTSSVSMTSGSVSLVAYRVLAALELSVSNIPNAIDAVSGSLPICYDNTTPFLIFIPQATSTTVLSGIATFAQG